MQTEPLRQVTAAEIDAYRRDGAVHLPAMLGADWVERLLPTALRLMNAEEQTNRALDLTQDEEAGRFYANSYMWRLDDDFRALAVASPLGEIAAQLIGCDEVRFYYDQLFVKEPGTSSRTRWHQDLPFWPFSGEDIVSLWVALTPVDRESSGVEYIAGSHRWGKFYRAEFSNKSTDRLNRLVRDDMEPCPDFDERRGDPDLRFLSWSLEPGDIVVHHPLTVHGSGGNPATGRGLRAGVSNRYMGPDVRWDPRPGAAPVEGDPIVEPGLRPTDDRCFPVVWRRGDS